MAASGRRNPRERAPDGHEDGGGVRHLAAHLRVVALARVDEDGDGDQLVVAQELDDALGAAGRGGDEQDGFARVARAPDVFDPVADAPAELDRGLAAECGSRLSALGFRPGRAVAVGRGFGPSSLLYRQFLDRASPARTAPSRRRATRRASPAPAPRRRGPSRRASCRPVAPATSRRVRGPRRARTRTPAAGRRSRGGTKSDRRRRPARGFRLSALDSRCSLRVAPSKVEGRLPALSGVRLLAVSFPAPSRRPFRRLRRPGRHRQCRAGCCSPVPRPSSLVPRSSPLVPPKTPPAVGRW